MDIDICIEYLSYFRYGKGFFPNPFHYGVSVRSARIDGLCFTRVSN